MIQLGIYIHQLKIHLSYLNFLTHFPFTNFKCYFDAIDNMSIPNSIIISSHLLLMSMIKTAK